MSVSRLGSRAACWLCLSLFSQALHGHAILLSAVPAANQIVIGPDIHVGLRFNSRIDAKRSRITLIAANGQQTVVLIEKQTDADTLSSNARGLTSGPYILRWQVLAVDGHITRGEVPFEVQ